MSAAALQDFLWLVRMLALLKLPLRLFGGARRPVVPCQIPGECPAPAGCGRRALPRMGVDAARRRRRRQPPTAFARRKLAETQALGRVLPDGSALVAYTGYKDAAVPLLFDRDIVILDARADEGKDAPILIRELLGRNRRVFVLEDGFPGEVLSGVLSGWQVCRSRTRDRAWWSCAPARTEHGAPAPAPDQTAPHRNRRARRGFEPRGKRVLHHRGDRRA